MMLPHYEEVQAELGQRDEEAPVGNVVERFDGKVTTGVGPTFRCSACSSENAACFSRMRQVAARIVSRCPKNWGMTFFLLDFPSGGAEA
jgi:hypothetical protein